MSVCFRCGFPGTAPEELVAPPIAPCPSYLTSNVAPDPSGSSQVLQAISHARNAISSVEEQMAALKLVLGALEARRDAYIGFIDAHEKILTPIRQLPTELMAEIFLRCVEGEQPPWNPPTNIEWRLAQVCIAWRTLALSTPALWRRLFITHTYSPYDVLSADILRNTLALQLRRAAQAPLLISFTTVDFDEADYLRTVQRAIIIHALLPSAHRWEEAEVHLTKEEMHMLRSGTDSERTKPVFPLLKALDFSYLGRSDGNELISVFHRDDDVDAIAPHLQHLGYYGGFSPVPLRSLRVRLESPSVPWARIRSLALRHYQRWNAELRDGLAILRLARALEELELEDFSPGRELQLLGGIDTGLELISLEKLKSLTFNASNDALLQHIRAPNLEFLSFSQLPSQAAGGHILAFLSHSTLPPLTHLTLNDLNVPLEWLLEILAFTPDLHELILRDVGRAISAELVAALTLREAGEVDEGKMYGNLVPRVQALEMTGYFRLNEAGPLVDLVRSRCGLVSSAGHLRHVKFSGLGMPKDSYNLLREEGFGELI
ncbi:hypothetical protein C8F01DRAFT_1120811 [Mycena amicta]|nr:hypothetical protein C8F01DRAFT_1120811 [Mycena amicta]